ncbi:hypothetical protein F2Q69_00043810 [Brassica cretica]|uniref:Uncharacterized protein n=1 Tax=Brassica cretica TaxID=69181 RepID=A0A8S9NKX4_BRACR|nr:hypothetical protein F2Q69_00043810 [Brassica cretica]
MGRIPCCEKENVKRGQWTPEEDNKLASYIAQHGTRNWRLIPKNAGLQRCGKSCRLRWTNYLRPDLKHGQFSEAEEHIIVKFHSVLGNRWSLIAAQLPGRTDNDVKNYWNTKLKKKLSGMGIDPVTHKPFSHLMAEITTTLNPPQVSHLAEAALGCFKDEMLHLLTKKRVDLNQINFSNPNPNNFNRTVDNEAGKMKMDGLENGNGIMKLWDMGNGFSYGSSSSSFGNEDKNDGSASPAVAAWRGQGGIRTAVAETAAAEEEERSKLKGEVVDQEENGSQGGRGDGMLMMRSQHDQHQHHVFNVDNVLWDLQADDLINHVRSVPSSPGPNWLNSPGSPSGLIAKRTLRVDIPVDDYPNYNFVGRLLGPRGNSLKRVEASTDCRVLIRGRGSIKDPVKEEMMRGKPGFEHLNEPLHILVEAELPIEIVDARLMQAREILDDLLTPMEETHDVYKKQQLRELALLNGTLRDEGSPMSGSVSPFNGLGMKRAKTREDV